MFDLIKARIQETEEGHDIRVVWLPDFNEKGILENSYIDFLAHHLEDKESVKDALLETVEHSKYGWENIVPSLLNLGTVLLDSQKPTTGTFSSLLIPDHLRGEHNRHWHLGYCQDFCLSRVNQKISL